MRRVYVGWIPGLPNDTEKWRSLGVAGEMRFRWAETAFGYGVIEQCEVANKETLDLLVKNGLPNPQSFSLIERL